MFEGSDWFDIEDLLARHKNERDAETQRRQALGEYRAARDRIIEGGKGKIRAVLEDREAEKVQELETNTWELQEQESSCAEQPRPVFKGIIERSFALINDKLCQPTPCANEKAIAPIPGMKCTSPQGGEAQEG
jgi:hypothetical protein